MRWFYGLLIRFYYIVILIVSPFNKKAKAWLKGRIDLFNNLKRAIGNETDVIWFHCSSLGEFEQGRPVIEEYKSRFPDQKILLTFFSPSGYEIRKNYQGADWVCYLPLDTRKNVKNFLEIVNPKKVYFVKYEFWYNFLKTIYQKNIPLFLISAVFRKEQLFFKTYGRWYKKMLGYFTHIFVQNQVSVELLYSIGIKNVTIAGDTRFDRVIAIANAKKEIAEASKFTNKNNVLIAGSTWPKDEEILIPFINQSSENIRFIIAQHEISEKTLLSLENNLSVAHIRFSNAANADLEKVRVLIIDNVGMLSQLYQYGTIAYIGGGFGKGIHNILEAAVYGMPVLFGPNYSKFTEANEMISLKGAFSITSYHEFSEKVNALISKPDYLKETSGIAKNYVIDRTGATQRIFSEIND